MRQPGAVQTLVWIALGGLAVLFLKWRDRDIEQEAAQPIPLLFDSAANVSKLDSLPKPFARMKAPILLTPRRTESAARPLKLLAEPGETVPVSITAYCLSGRTRTGTTVRDGIVAADPRVFPLNSEIDIIIGRDTLGRFRVEDTGLLIKGRKIDLWLADCGEARSFGRKRGSAKLVSKIRR
ncbi:MAG: 3D domain-containing protein [Gemmatimonadaceae bacterium]